MRRAAGNELSMRRCPSCRSLCALPFPSPEELAAYYNSDYSVIDAGLTPRRRANWTPLLEKAERLAGLRNGIEIGSSTGAFLRLATERGWTMAGVELDARARQAHARTSPDIPVRATVEAAREAGIDHADAAWVLHTIEHLPDPEAVLRETLDLMTPGAPIAVTTPNGMSLECRVLGPLWEWWTPPAHLTLFSPRGACLLLERAGFEIVSVETRRGDSSGAAANAALAPARFLKRRLRGERQQRSSVSSVTQRVAACINLLYDPISNPLRGRLYRHHQGPELVIVARRPGPRTNRPDGLETMGEAAR
ncbi:MAG: class I SAM-dependent methyltransferase [Dehalococcoidia bacterium]